MNVAPRPQLNILSVCAGIGGIDIALGRNLGVGVTKVYVERELAACAILAARMEDGSLDSAPIWTDLATFPGAMFRGHIDLVIAGLPCQPYSVAGKRRGDRDERYIWPDFFRILREVRPAMVFLENVPALLAWFRSIGEELCGMGYEVTGGLFSAAEVGAPHKRERLFVLAERIGSRRAASRIGCDLDAGSESEAGRGTIAHTGDVGYAERKRLATALAWSSEHRKQIEASGLPLFPPGPGEREAWAAILERWPELAPAVADGCEPPTRNDYSLHEGQEALEREVCGMANGNSMDLVRSDTED